MTVAKYSASGNDFVIFHTFVKKDRSALAKALCDRQEGVGADGMIVLLPHESCDFEWQFYNADGSSAAMCGNGSRAAAHYAFKEGLAGAEIRFLTQAGTIEAKVDGDIVESELTPPEILERGIEEGGKIWWLIDTGVPHLVTLVDNVDTFDKEEARELRNRYNANVNYASAKDGVIRVRTYERGVEDETLACGTGMAAAFLRASLEGFVAESAVVIPAGGERLNLAKKGERLTLKGEVRRIFDAKLEREFD